MVHGRLQQGAGAMSSREQGNPLIQGFVANAADDTSSSKFFADAEFIGERRARVADR